MPVGEIASNIPDSDVMREVEECEQQCMEIYVILSELKKRVGELLSVTESNLKLSRLSKLLKTS